VFREVSFTQHETVTSEGKIHTARVSPTKKFRPLLICTVKLG